MKLFRKIALLIEVMVDWWHEVRLRSLDRRIVRMLRADVADQENHRRKMGGIEVRRVVAIAKTEMIYHRLGGEL